MEKKSTSRTFLFNMTTHSNSILAFMSLQLVLTERQKEVLEVYKSGDFTDQEAADMLRFPINRVSGRVGELLKRKVIVEKGSKISDGFKRRICGINHCTLF